MLDVLEAVENEVRRACEAGDFEGALARTVRGYGPEVLAFLVARFGDRDVASDVFSQTCEDLWMSLPDFEWRCSMRTWVYKLARSAAYRHTRRVENRPSRRDSLSQISDVIDQVRTRTLVHMRTEVKDLFAQLRDELPAEDRTILILRVDRDLAWNEVAQVFLDEGNPDDEAVAREAARLRQRFRQIKDRLRDRARELGLL